MKTAPLMTAMVLVATMVLAGCSHTYNGDVDDLVPTCNENAPSAIEVDVYDHDDPDKELATKPSSSDVREEFAREGWENISLRYEGGWDGRGDYIEGHCPVGR